MNEYRSDERYSHSSKQTPDWLRKKILLFIDNVSSHYSALKDMFSDIRIIFLPKNTTSSLQPLDADII